MIGYSAGVLLLLLWECDFSVAYQYGHQCNAAVNLIWVLRFILCAAAVAQLTAIRRLLVMRLLRHMTTFHQTVLSLRHRMDLSLSLIHI